MNLEQFYLTRLRTPQRTQLASLVASAFTLGDGFALTSYGRIDIEWTEATWNPISGCTLLAPSCTNCYAMQVATRLQAMGMTEYAGTTRKSGKRHVWTGRVNIDRKALTVPLGWKKPQRQAAGGKRKKKTGRILGGRIYDGSSACEEYSPLHPRGCITLPAIPISPPSRRALARAIYRQMVGEKGGLRTRCR